MIKIAYKNISYGARGEDVKKLQKALNSKGYKLSVDGKFGPKTKAAVKDYQKKNNLKVDGVVGKNTWNSLNKTKKATATKTTQTKTKTTSKASNPRPVYNKSENVLLAEKELENWEQNKPGDYESQYGAQIDELLSEILNREDFSYNLGADPLYEQYRDIYTGNGKKAMMDTVGQASALTGGYSNSYAVTAGSQAYQEYLNELNGVALDLRDRAYEEYLNEGDKLVEDITILRSLDGDDYEKYLGMLEQYYSDGSYLLEKLVSMSDAEFESFLAEVDAWENDRDYAFKQYQDKLDRQEFEKELAFKKSEAKRDQANKDREYALQKSKASRSGGSGGKSSKKSKSNSKTGVSRYPKSYAEFCNRTGFAGIMTQSEYNKSSTVKEMYKTYQKYLNAMYDKYS